MSRPLVLYHANCPDGFCAAWVAHRKFGDAADYVPVQYGQEPPDVKHRDVFILDFSYKRPVMEQMRRDTVTLTVLDHHKTAQAELAGFGKAGPNEETNVRCIFDMDKSGGRLAWEFFFRGKESPWLVDYTEDRDLWLWKLPKSKELSAAIASHPKDFALWDRWAGFTNAAEQVMHQFATSGDYRTDFFAGLVAEGAAILRYQQQLVDSHCENAVEIDMDGHKILAVNATCLFSEIAGKLAEGRPFGAAWFQRKDGKRQWSLRSRNDAVDVSQIAKAHGGGGHRNAAGFEEVVQ